MVTFYQRLDYKSRKKPLVSQIIIYFFHLLQQRQKLIHLTPIKKKKVLQTLLPSQRTRQLLCNTFIIHSREDHSISGWSPQLLLQELSQVHHSISSKRYCHLRAYGSLTYYRSSLWLQITALRGCYNTSRRDKSDYRSSHAISDLACRV